MIKTLYNKRNLVTALISFLMLMIFADSCQSPDRNNYADENSRQKDSVVFFNEKAAEVLDGSARLSLIYADSAWLYAKTCKDTSGMALALQNSGKAYNKLIQNDSAILKLSLSNYYYHKVLKNKKDTPSVKSQHINTHRYLAETFINIAKFDSANAILYDILKYESESKEGISLSAIYMLLGESYYYLSSYDSSKYYYAKGIYESEKKYDSAYLGSLYSSLALTYKKAGNYDSAIKYNFIALDMHQKQKNKPEEIITLINIGSVYAAFCDYKKATHYFEKAILLCDTVNDKTSIATCMNNLGYIQIKQNNNVKAKESFFTALKIYQSQGDKNYSSYCMNNLGQIYFKLKDYPSAIRYFDNAIDLCNSNKNDYLKAGVLINLANTYAEIPDFTKAFESIKQAENITLLMRSDETMKEVYFSYYNLLKKKKNPAEALVYYEKYKHINDSLVSAKNSNSLNEMEIKILSEKKELEKSFLANEKDRKIKYRNTTIILMGSFIALFLVLAVILIVNYIGKYKAYKLLVKKNHEIAKQELIHVENANIQSSIVLEDVQKIKMDENLTEYITVELNNKLFREKVFTDKEVNLTDLARKLNTNSAYLSRVINQKYNTNFNDLINELRIKEARRLMAIPDNNIYTLEGIASQVGFNSKSTFNRAFKRFMGITPSFYAKHMK